MGTVSAVGGRARPRAEQPRKARFTRQRGKWPYCACPVDAIASLRGVFIGLAFAKIDCLLLSFKNAKVYLRTKNQEIQSSKHQILNKP